MTENAKTPMTRSLEKSTLEIERHVASGGWDAPIRLFALALAKNALAQHPELAGELPADVQADAIEDETTLFSIEQEGLPQVETLEDLLGRIVWPADVDGAALSVERIILPPSAEVSLPEDPAEADKVLASHPDRQDVRIVAAVLRTGESWCAIRMRKFDDDAKVLSGANLIPGLVEGLKMGFAEQA
ncbi:MAG: PPA1309 family protein [Trueperella sp.]|uniref:PPA1309 family protein n=1 Tax=Trueperella sp. TaxID=2699835 RepID=UPI0025DDDD7E|nr:PPA1309 family protein [Trueperella sp.]MCI7304882.1 PPA1309 family protein [Trueperella sp.]MDY5404327.1 PPA1309 family protein [Trueperella sp.]